MLQRVINLFRPKKIKDASALSAFIEGEASFLSNKVSIGYCRMKTSGGLDAMVSDAEFREKLEICRWESFALILGDLLIMTATFLRTIESEGAAISVDGLASEYGAILQRQALPQHRRAIGWSDRIAAFDERYARNRLGPLPDPSQIPEQTARAVHALLPLHETLKGNDLDLIIDDLRFCFIACWQQLEKRIAKAELGRSLSAR